VGEVLKVWTDGIFSSTLHRVINRSAASATRSRSSCIQATTRDPAADEKIPDPEQRGAGESAHLDAARQAFVYGEFKARSTARIMPGKVAVPS